MEMIFSDLRDNIYANPHSLHASSKLTEDHVDLIRYRILQHFQTTSDEYSIIFTSGATESLRVVAETFDYGNIQRGNFVYLQNNHTSVLGMRGYSKNCKELKTDEAFQYLSKNYEPTENYNENFNNLFAYPAQCNFSGTKYPLEWIEKIQKGALNAFINTASPNWYVLLDAACFLSHEILNLSIYKPDFVAVSFYKIFGYPTGLGALLVRKSSEGVLKKRYFGGGTVLMATSAQNVTMPRKILSERFEDGTIPFLGVLSLKHGFDTLTRLKLTFTDISKHTFNLARYVYRSLLSLHHSNGRPVAVLFHDTTFENPEHQGHIVNFNLLRENGEHVGYSEVLQLANLHGIQLRTGCHCNPGGCQRFLKLLASDVIKHFNSGHVCGDQRDLIDGQPTGTVRISFGYMSTKEDADKFLNLIENCFVSKPIVRKIPDNYGTIQQNYRELFHGINDKTNNNEPNSIIKTIPAIKNPSIREENIYQPGNAVATLQQIILYPIKSCGAFSVSHSWKVTKKGLKFDREWMVVNAAGVCLTQKQNKKMCLIKPVINSKTNTLTLRFRGKRDVEINIDDAVTGKETYLCQSKVCGDRVVGWDCGDAVSDWLSENLEAPGLRLLRQFEPDEEDLQLSFANQAQYLLINSTSVEWLRNQVPEGELDEDLESTISRFRPNLVARFSQPFEENGIKEILIGDLSFKFFGNCTRCQMICIDQKTGGISKEPLMSLSKAFKGKINFGIYLNRESSVEEGTIVVGASITEKDGTSL
ncbi:unnamed protein product [Phyllotreta striolata]|nr:unnamed protein product [Phyllotreta striolata]